MKKYSLLILLFGSLCLGAMAQSTGIYSLTRPQGGGSLQFTEFNLAAGTETIIDTYSSAEMDDYDPAVTSFDKQNNRFIVLASDQAENPFLAAIDASNGNIVHSYVPVNVEAFSAEYANGKVYALTRPTGGGNLQLTQFDLGAGTETIIATYQPSEINDYVPGGTTFDHDNNRLIAWASDQAENPFLVSINAANGNIVHTYAPMNVEAFSVEYSGNKVYSLTRPIGGGNLQLTQFDLGAGTEAVLYTYTPNELEDYVPAVTTFDHQNNRFVTLASDQVEDAFIASINVSNGSIAYSHVPTLVEAFSVETSGLLIGIEEETQYEVLQLAPNPVVNELRFNNMPTQGLVEIIDVLGQVVASHHNAYNTINVTHLVPGAYTVRVTTKKAIGIGQFIKQ